MTYFLIAIAVIVACAAMVVVHRLDRLIEETSKLKNLTHSAFFYSVEGREINTVRSGSAAAEQILAFLLEERTNRINSMTLEELLKAIKK